MECNGIIGVDDLNLTAGTAEWAVKVEGAVATNDDVLEFLIQFRESCVTVTVVDMHGNHDLVKRGGRGEFGKSVWMAGCGNITVRSH